MADRRTEGEVGTGLEKGLDCIALIVQKGQHPSSLVSMYNSLRVGDNRNEIAWL